MGKDEACARATAVKNHLPATMAGMAKMQPKPEQHGPQKIGILESFQAAASVSFQCPDSVLRAKVSNIWLIAQTPKDYG